MIDVTSEQLAGYLYDDEAATGRLPVDAARLLARASELVADTTLTAVYDVDDDDNPTDDKVIGGMRDAVCAQVEFWVAGDEEDDVLGPLQGMSTGTGQQQYGAGENRATPMYLAPRAARHLRLAGLLGGAVGTRATW